MKGHPKTTARKTVVQSAVNRVARGIVHDQSGVSQADALRFARIILSRPGVVLGAKGNIYWNGKAFNASQFAKSTLAQRATGLTARNANESAITGSPAYLQAMAELGMQRDQTLAANTAQRQQSLAQFGDPTFAGSDALTASAAAANPYSTTRLMGEANTNQIGRIGEAANRAGTYFGGGLQSGLQQQQLAYGGQVQDATTKLQNLLSAINMSDANAQQAYNVGMAGAKTDAYNQLLASGYTAQSQPTWTAGPIAVKGFGKAPIPRPPVAVGFGGHPIPGPPPPQQPRRFP